MATTVCTVQWQVPIKASVSSSTWHSSQQGLQTRTVVAFPWGGCGLSLSSRQERSGRRIHCTAGGDGEGKGCCGGSGGDGQSTGSSGKCSSHGSSNNSNVDVSDVGKEFEALMAKKTMEEFEAQYDSAEMVGTIARDVISDVVNIYPDASPDALDSLERKIVVPEFEAMSKCYPTHILGMKSIACLTANAKSASNEEKFLDVEDLLKEARALSSKNGDFVFDADFEDMLV